jgi:REP element-mobilizing transposase RayT
MRRVLIIDEDKQFATDLWVALRKLGDFKVTVCRTLNEACLALIQETQDLAFLPLKYDDRPIRSLLALQSELCVVLTSSDIVTSLPESISAKTAGLLLKNRLHTALPGILAIVFDQAKPTVDTPDAHAAIHTGILGPRVQAGLLLQGKKLVTHWGNLSKANANLITETVNQGWAEAEKNTQVQFLRFPEQGHVLLLYTRVLSPGQPVDQEKRYLFTLVAAPEVSLSWLRTRADKLVENLSYVVYTAAAPPKPVTTPNSPTYAIVWAAEQPFATTQVPLVRRTLERIAIANACALTHIDVQPQLIHLVVTCPPGRSSGWAVHTLKSGSDEAIRQEIEQKRPLWNLGHYARESAEPLTSAELNIFLQNLAQ